MMKNSKRNFIIAILACLCTACIALGTARFTPVKAEEYRTVSTYDFEDDSTAGWGNNNNCTFEISSEAYAGEKSLKSTLIDGKTQNRIQRQFAVGEGETFKEGYHYVFTFYAKSSVDSAIEGWFYVYDDKGGTTSLKFSATTTAAAKLTEEWKKYSFAITMEVVDGAVKAGRIWTDSVNYSYGTGTNNGATKVTSFNMVLFCNAQVWYMDDFIVSTDEPETPVAPVTPDPVPEGHRIVTESSFEDDSSAGWFNNGFSTHEISSDAYIGEKSLKSTLKAGETQNRIQRTFAVGEGELIQEGNTYTFSLYAKSSAASGIEGYFYIYDDTEGTTTVKFSAPTAADAYLTSEWKKYTYSLIMGVEDGAVTGRRVWTDGSDYAFSGSNNGATKVTSFNMLLFCDAEEWYMDEFIITTDAALPKPDSEPVPEGKYLIASDGFESGTSTGWINYGMSSHSVTNDGYVGEKALKSTLIEGETQNRIQRAFVVGEYETLAEGAVYEISFWARSETASGLNGYFYIYDDQGGTTTVRFGDATDDTSALTGEWRKYSFTISFQVTEGVVSGSRTFINGSNSYAYSDKTGVNKITSVNMLIYCDAQVWYMDEFRIVSETAPKVKPAEKTYSTDVSVTDFNDETLSVWTPNSNTEYSFEGETDKYLHLTPTEGTSTRIQTKIPYGENGLNEAMTLYLSLKAKGEGSKIYAYIQVNYGVSSRTITLMAGSTLTDGFVLYPADIKVTMGEDKIYFVWHRPDYSSDITTENDLAEGDELRYADLIIELVGEGSIDDITVSQKITVTENIAAIIDAIADLGEVTDADKENVETLRGNYNALSAEDKARVFNISALEKAEARLRLYDVVPGGDLSSLDIDYSARDYTGAELSVGYDGLTVIMLGANGEKITAVMPGEYAVYGLDFYLEGVLAGRLDYETPQIFIINRMPNENVVSASVLMIDPNNEAYMLAAKYEVSETEDFSIQLSNSGSLIEYKGKTLYLRERATDIYAASAVTPVEIIVYTVTLPEENEAFTVFAVKDTNEVLSGGYFKFTVTVSEGYDGTPVVKADGEILEADEGVYSLSVTANTEITVEGISAISAPIDSSEESDGQTSESESVSDAEGGCFASLGGGTAALIFAAGIALVALRRRKND